MARAPGVRVNFGSSSSAGAQACGLDAARARKLCKPGRSVIIIIIIIIINESVEKKIEKKGTIEKKKI